MSQRLDRPAGLGPARPGMKAFARAVFRGYQGQPGEIQLKMPGDMSIEVEVFKDRGDNWKARAVHGRGVFKGIEGPVETAMRNIAARFNSQETEWHWVDEHGHPAEAATENQGLHHLIGPIEDQQMFLRIRRTLCGRTVMSHRIEERLEKVNCPQCRIALDKMPAE